jgi:hypothetical protein
MSIVPNPQNAVNQTEAFQTAIWLALYPHQIQHPQADRLGDGLFQRSKSRRLKKPLPRGAENGLSHRGQTNHGFDQH